MTIDQELALNGHGDSQVAGGIGQMGDSRVPLGNGHINDSNLNQEEEPKTLDMDFFSTETGEQFRTRRPRKPHVFGQVENSRGTHDQQQTQFIGEDEGHERARRRAAGLPIIQRTKIPMSFPLLDSFPHIFAQTSTTPPSLAVSTSLSTDTSVALRVKSLQNIVNRAISVDEREALSNSLGEIAEAYEEGWDSGTDEDDD